METLKFTYVPEHISESAELSLASKKLLEALLNYQFNSKAYDTGKLFINNATLCKLSKVGHSQLMKSIVELKMYSLVDRVQGGERGNASEYIIHFEKLKEPLKRKSFDDMFGRFMKGGQSLETPMGTTITTTITTPITTTITTPITTTTSTTIPTTSPTTSPIENTMTSSTTSSIESITTSSTTSSIESTTTIPTTSPIEIETKKVIEMKSENEMKTDNEIENTLFQLFEETFEKDIEEVIEIFDTNFDYSILSKKELGKKLTEIALDRIGYNDYSKYSKICDNVETVFGLVKPNTINVKNEVEEDMVRIGKYQVIPRKIYEMLEEPEDALPF